MLLGTIIYGGLCGLSGNRDKGTPQFPGMLLACGKACEEAISIQHFPGDFPGGPLVESSPANAGDTGRFNAWSGN